MPWGHRRKTGTPVCNGNTDVMGTQPHNGDRDTRWGHSRVEGTPTCLEHTTCSGAGDTDTQQWGCGGEGGGVPPSPNPVGASEVTPRGRGLTCPSGGTAVTVQGGDSPLCPRLVNPGGEGLGEQSGETEARGGQGAEPPQVSPTQLLLLVQGRQALKGTMKAFLLTLLAQLCLASLVPGRWGLGGLRPGSGCVWVPLSPVGLPAPWQRTRRTPSTGGSRRRRHCVMPCGSSASTRTWPKTSSSSWAMVRWGPPSGGLRGAVWGSRGLQEWGSATKGVQQAGHWDVLGAVMHRALQ